MKNTTIFFVLMLFSCVVLTQTASVAQIRSTETNSHIGRVGVRIGGNSVLPLERIDDATYHPTVSYHGGLMANLGRGWLSFQPEINFSQRRVWADYMQQGVIVSVKAKTNRVEVPLLVRAMFGDAARAKPRFFINAGPYGAYVLDEGYKASTLSYGELSASLRPVIDAVVGSLNNRKATFDGNKGRISYGMAGGLGMAFNAGLGQLTLEGRALYQLGDNAPTIDDPSGTGLAANVRDTRYALIQASVGYMIPVGSR